MAVIYYKEKFGEMTIRQGERKFKIEIRDGNCLAVFVYLYTREDGTKCYALYNFWNDKPHTDRIVKNCGVLFGDDVVSVSLNLYYKESFTLLRIFTKNGYKVNCYYNENKYEVKVD